MRHAGWRRISQNDLPIFVRMAQADPIFQEIAAYRHYPADLFQNDAKYKDEILRRLGLSTEKQ